MLFSEETSGLTEETKQAGFHVLWGKYVLSSGILVNWLLKKVMHALKSSGIIDYKQ